MAKNTQGDNQKAPAKQTTATADPSPIKSRGSFLSSLTMDDKICLLLLLCVIVTVIMIRNNFLSMPFERDEGSYSYYGKVLLQGKIPYKDFYEQKFPGIFYFYAFIISIFGSTVEGLHTGFMYLNVATIIIIYFASRRLFSPIAGIISATTYAFVSLTPFLSGFTVQSEHGSAFFISLGLLFYALYNGDKRWYYNFLMGLSFGCALMVKTNGVFLVLWGGLMLIINFFFQEKKSFKDLLAQVAIYSGGVFSIVAVLFLIIIMKGVWSNMILWAYTVPKHYVGKVPFSQGINYFYYGKDMITQNYMFFWVHSIAAVIVCLVNYKDLKALLFGITLLAFSVLTITPGFYFYGHYWIQIIPGLAIVAGLTYHSLMKLLQEKAKIKFAGLKYAYLTVFALFVVAHVSANKAYYFQPDYEEVLRAVYGGNPFPEDMEIGNFINSVAKPQDGLVVIGSEPQLYIYTNKPCPSSHLYFAFLVDNIPEHHQWQREFARDVEKAAPKYLVFCNHPISLLVQPNTDHFIFDWLQHYVDSNYKMIGIADMVYPHSKYVWKDAVQSYRPQGKEVLYVFERKS